MRIDPDWVTGKTRGSELWWTNFVLAFVGLAVLGIFAYLAGGILWAAFGEGAWLVLLGCAVAISVAIARLSRWLGGG